MSRPNERLTLAAVDLGSNSFHLLIARAIDQELQIVDRMRDPVCLAAGLDGRNRIDEPTQSAALESLVRIGQRLRDLPGERVRAVGTNALRVAKNSREFLARARESLGHEIEIVSGQEEARLIYLGVAHSDFSAEPRLIVDIGGGSTEVILGEGFEVLQAHSLYMGCVSHSRRFFEGGAITRSKFREAEIASRLELRAIQKRLRTMGWTATVGASGTIRAISELLQNSGSTDGTITLPALKRLRRALLAAGGVERLTFTGLREERARVLPGGLAILIGLFKALGIESMTTCAGTLREGLLYDLVGRMRHEDVRDLTIRRMGGRYRIDLLQAARVERTAERLIARVGPPLDSKQNRKRLVWASRLHEIGLAVSHTGFHKHGAYLVAHSDMAGFSADDQMLLSALIRGHRRKFSRQLFSGVAAFDEQTAFRLCVLFRLAVLLNRGRVSGIVPDVDSSSDGSEITLRFEAGWKRDHPLSVADLERERTWLAAAGVRLGLDELPAPPSTARPAEGRAQPARRTRHAAD